MIIARAIDDVRRARKALTGPVGFVPTMGYLHRGHLALVEAARRDNAAVVVSIFVNPTQFGPKEDFLTYPRDLDRDLTYLAPTNVDVVFVPSVEEMYPPGFSTGIEVGSVAERLEGARRPGHFRGVATVVARLFNVVGPDRAYFGQKDAQQCVVVRKLVRELGFPIEIVVVPTVRDPDGLALSSRNVYLDSEERAAALVLSRALRDVQARYAAGERDGEHLRRLVTAAVAAEPRVQLEYVSVADPNELRELFAIEDAAIVSLAARVGKTRLIDNVSLG